MFRNMVTSLFKYDRIRTTDAKAKELRRLADNMITLAKRGDLHARRQALAVIREKSVVHKLFENANERFGNVNGGYTRVIKLGRRPGDAAPISIVELVAMEKEKKKKKKKKVDTVKDTPKAAPTADEKPDATPQEKTGVKEPEAAAQPVEEEVSAPEISDDEAAEERAEDIRSAEAGEDVEAAKEVVEPESETAETEETKKE